MPKVCGIYKITSPKGRIYIGQSVDCNKRMLGYRRNAYTTQLRLYNSIKKHGWNKHRFEVIHQCSPRELNDLEIYYIQLFQCFNSANGLNLRSGGGSGGGHSDETKKKISARQMGNTIWLGRHHSDDTRKILQRHHTGMRYSEKTNKKKAAHRGENPMAKIVLNTENGIYYGCVADAADTIGMPHKSLANKLRGYRTNRTLFIYA